MSLMGLVVMLIVVGVALWLINKFIPMEPKIKQLLTAIVVIVAVLWVLCAFLGIANIGHISIR